MWVGLNSSDEGLGGKNQLKLPIEEEILPLILPWSQVCSINSARIHICSVDFGTTIPTTR